MEILNLGNSILGVTGTSGRIITIGIAAVGSHLAVLLVKHLSRFVSARMLGKAHPKWKSIASLSTSILIFTIYFGVFGLILHELGVSLTAYLASASVIGLAVGFGSQGVVQDVVTGLTFVFSDLVDVGDMVEISGQTGVVKSIGMRFVTLENPLGAKVFIPNRSIANVTNYPRGYIRCIVDVLLVGNEETRRTVEKMVNEVMTSAFEQFPNILVAPPSVEGRIRTSTGKEFVRVKFRIWPGRGTPIETTFKQELLKALQGVDSSYADWMISVTYEVEKVLKDGR